MELPTLQEYVFSRNEGVLTGGYPVSKCTDKNKTEGLSKLENLVVPVGLFKKPYNDMLRGGDGTKVKEMDGGVCSSELFDKTFQQVAKVSLVKTPQSKTMRKK
jgi:hypothetical protein